MKKEGYWVVRTYQAGRVGEKIKYWLPGRKPTKSVRRMKSDIRKQQQNENDATKRAARIINANFRGGDAFDAYTYSEEGYAKLTANMPDDLNEQEQADYIYAKADHQLELLCRRCRYACKKAGVAFKFFAITSDMDGETGEMVRIHHHIIVPKEIKHIVRELWTMGGIEKNSVWNEDDHFGLAKYLMDQVRRIPDAKKYKRSRNLVVPEPKDRIAKGGKEVQPPKGASVIYRREFVPGRPQYIRYIIQKDKSGGDDEEYPGIGGTA